MRQAFAAGKLCNCADFFDNEKLTVWASVNEGMLQVRWNKKTNTERPSRSMSCCESTDFLRRIIVPVAGQGGVTLWYVCPHCHRFPIEDYTWWVSSGHVKKQCNWWCAACGGQYNWRHPNRILVIQESTDRREAKVFRARAPPHGVCDNLIHALKLLAKQYHDGDSPVRVLVESLQERSRLQMMEELRKFIMMDNHEAVRIGEVDNAQESRQVVKPKNWR